MNEIPAVPEELVLSLKSNRTAAFIGAGLSVGAGYPTWYKLLKMLIERASAQGIIDAPKKEEFEKVAESPAKWLMVAQELSDAFGTGPFHSELGTIFEGVKAEPTEAHMLITELPFSFVVTTNYDQLIETAYLPKLKRIPKIFTHQDSSDFADALWKEEFFILKAHGDLGKKSTIVLTEKDYRNVIYSAPGYRALLAAIFTTKTVFFTGASLSDPEVKLLLSSLFDAFQGSGQYHFALISRTDFSDVEANHWRKNYNVRCICYEPTVGHPELAGFLRSLHDVLA